LKIYRFDSWQKKNGLLYTKQYIAILRKVAKNEKQLPVT